MAEEAPTPQSCIMCGSTGVDDGPGCAHCREGFVAAPATPVPQEVVGPVRTLTKVGFILSGVHVALMLPAVVGMILPGGRDIGFIGLIGLAFVVGAPFAVLAAVINAVSWFREKHHTAKVAAGMLVLVHLGACVMTVSLMFSGNSRLLG